MGSANRPRKAAARRLLPQYTKAGAIASALKVSEDRLAGILNLAPDAIISVDAAQRIVLFNRGAERVFGYASAEVVGQPLDVLLPASLASAHRQQVQEFVSGAAEYRLMGERDPVRARRKGGEVFEAEVSIAKLDTGSGMLCTAYLRDLTEQRRAETALRTSEQRFRTAFENAPIGMALVHPDLRFLKVNQALCRILGYTEAELLELGPAAVSHPDDWRAQRERVAASTEPLDFLELEKRYIHRNGQTVWVRITSSLTRDGRGEPVVYVTQYQDITERKRFEAELVHLANHDPLTDLFNRRRFEEAVEHHLAMVRRYGGGGALVFLDLDDFKDVNDSLGHRAGDELLVTIAHRLRGVVRGADVLARLGGDEFAVLLPQTDVSQAGRAVSRMLGAVRAQALVGSGQPVQVAASAGVVFLPDHGATAEELLARADLAMYRAKEAGGNQFLAFEPDQDWQAQIAARRTWEFRIREALDTGKFTLYAQPIWDLRRNSITRYELLLRMIDADGQLVLPGAFLDLAEHSGLIKDIDRWVIRQAISLLADPARLNSELVLEVNLSGRAFSDSELLPLIQRDLDASGVAPNRLVVEVTETAAITNIHTARRFVETLRGMGCRFALDDFGIGYSSFAHLKHLSVDYLKIDGSFIRDLRANPVDQHLVRAMVEVARGLRKGTVAEFVQDQETVSLLRQLGVDYAQGFYIGAPKPVIEGLGR